MSKPTLFFSHSSKDKDMVLAIKNKVMKYTSGTLEIFQSSDGESIPFGTNWIHKVEEGLKEAKVMFVFVTENSISSGWIYFEAGYAYSKGVHVIPVGVGVSVGDLKAPLNLLQGFNITSADSLNNFLSIINREFNYQFQPQFTDDDFDGILSQVSSVAQYIIPFDQIVRSIKFELSGMYYEKAGEKKARDTESMFEQIKVYLDKHGIDYSLDKLYGYGHEKGSVLAVQGIKLVYLHGIIRSLKMVMQLDYDTDIDKQEQMKIHGYKSEDEYYASKKGARWVDAVELKKTLVKLANDEATKVFDELRNLNIKGKEANKVLEIYVTYVNKIKSMQEAPFSLVDETTRLYNQAIDQFDRYKSKSGNRLVKRILTDKVMIFLFVVVLLIVVGVIVSNFFGV